MLHVDSFTCTITERGRSAIVETPEGPSSHIEEGLLVLASVEAEDEGRAAEVVAGTAQEVTALAERLKAHQVMLLPFAHLFGEPAAPRPALEILDAVAADLRSRGLVVTRPPFGWFHRWDLRAKGHPLSRVARTIPVDAGTRPQGGRR
jgi:hypothetical protein